jgi:hypothetical protein
LLVYLVAGL